MMNNQFPRTVVGGVSVPRLIAGTNWLLGYSHKSPAADRMIASNNSNGEAVYNQLAVYLKYGVDAMLGPLASVYAGRGGAGAITEGARLAEERLGNKVILIDTPMLDITDSAEGRKRAAEQIKLSKSLGATFCLLHTGCVEQLIDKHARKIRRLEDYLYMMRENDLIPGFASHVPEAVMYSDENGYDVETYIQVWNCMGFYMQTEVESYYMNIHNAKKPVITIKPMAAGRVTPLVGLTFSFNTIRDCDMVSVGAYTPDEVEEDIEIAFAAIEHVPVKSLSTRKALMKTPEAADTKKVTGSEP